MFSQDKVLEQSRELVHAAHKRVLGNVEGRKRDQERLIKTQERIVESEILIRETDARIVGYGPTRPRP